MTFETTSPPTGKASKGGVDAATVPNLSNLVKTVPFCPNAWSTAGVLAPGGS